MKPSFACFFAGLWSLYAMAYLAALTFLPVPAESRDFANIILGFLTGTVVSTLINYFYGSSDDKKPRPAPQTENVNG